jgi:pimeloyl-ACP methyl ester carboxylesterase
VRVRHLLATALTVALGGVAVATIPAAAVTAPSDGRATSGSSALSKPVGTVVEAEPLNKSLWIPNTTSSAFRLTYVTTDADGKRALSTGELFIPKGKAPAGGWPVISWAHGTSGLGDTCAPSVMGPAEPERDFPYMSNWMAQGYAIVATDYAGLGTAGLPAYLNGPSEAHNVVDMVRAGRAYATNHLPASQQLSNNWVVIGQSQGGGAAIYTARYATAFSGKDLRYLGAVGTGVPAYIENYVSLLGPKMPPTALPANVTAYLTYIVESLRAWRPALGIDSILTPTGRKYLELSQTSCVFAFEKQLTGVNIGDYFTRALATLPNWKATIDSYMKMPESGFDKPFFMGHGVEDTDVPYAPTAAYVGRLKVNRQPVTFKTYLADHSGTLVQSQKDAIPFVRALFARAGE